MAAAASAAARSTVVLIGLTSPWASARAQNLFIATLMDYDSGTATITGEIGNLAAFPLGSLVFGVFPDRPSTSRESRCPLT